MFDESPGLTGSGVTNSPDDRFVTRADRTTVPITTVFGRFKDMPISSTEADFTAHTYADLHGSTRRGSYFPINNQSHNFDVGTRSIRHHIIDFCPSNTNVPTNGAITLNSLVAVNIEVVGADPSPRVVNQGMGPYVGIKGLHRVTTAQKLRLLRDEDKKYARHPGECRRAAGTCFKCGQAGHLQKDCKKNTTVSTSGQADKKPALTLQQQYYLFNSSRPTALTFA
nr:hypothetical protein [Tanacetum cinerariifolium]